MALVHDMVAQLEALDELVKTKQREASLLRSAIEEIRVETTEPIKVSDHALIRYIERVKGIDLEGYRAEMLSVERRAAINAGATAITIDGAKFVVKDRAIVTCIKG
jgi:dTDP-4-amino-4,6-dideoxygalactose transaminase